MTISPEETSLQSEPRVKTFPVVEIFGPTIQGEGELQGTACHFIRFGGCDYKCAWCDSPHAVLPHLVRNASRLTQEQILERVHRLTPGPEWIVLSGGNPCLYDISELVVKLQLSGYKVALETQGTRYQHWIRRCNSVAVSPKPPSSGNVTDAQVVSKFLEPLYGAVHTFLKIVIFDSTDYSYARGVHRTYPNHQMYLSAGNDAGSTVAYPDRKDSRDNAKIARDLLARGRWLANRVMVDPQMKDVRVQCQMHVLLWGNERGR